MYRVTLGGQAVDISLKRMVHILLSPIHRLGPYKSIALGIVGVCVWDGVGYAAKGNSIAQGPSFIFLRESIPGGMHTHGYIMLVLAGFILYSMHDRPLMMYWVSFATMIYSVTISCALVWGWHQSGKVVWSGPSKWFLVIWLALTLLARATNSRRELAGQTEHRNES